MSGIPPTIGFYIKFLVLKSIIYAGYFYSAVFVLFFNTLSTFYYIRIIKIILMLLILLINNSTLSIIITIIYILNIFKYKENFSNCMCGAKEQDLIQDKELNSNCHYSNT